MNVLKALGSVVKVAAPVATGVFAGPEAGAVVGAAMGSAWAAKLFGKKVEPALGLRLQKLGAPAAAFGGATAASALVGPAAADQICQLVQSICSSPEALAGVLPAVIAVLGYMLGDNVQKTKATP